MHCPKLDWANESSNGMKAVYSPSVGHEFSVTVAIFLLIVNDVGEWAGDFDLFHVAQEVAAKSAAA